MTDNNEADKADLAERLQARQRPEAGTYHRAILAVLGRIERDAKQFRLLAELHRGLALPLPQPNHKNQCKCKCGHTVWYEGRSGHCEGEGCDFGPNGRMMWVMERNPLYTEDPK